MKYFKTLGAIDKSKFMETKVSTTTQGSVKTPGSGSMAATKANWPRCRPIFGQAADGKGAYMYTFGRKNICSKEWNQYYYSLIVQGKPLPPKPAYIGPKGSDSYFAALCKAQGDGEEGHKYRVAFDQAGWAWKPQYYDSHEHAHPPVTGLEAAVCSRYLKKEHAAGRNKEADWIYGAHYYVVKGRYEPEITGNVGKKGGGLKELEKQRGEEAAVEAAAEAEVHAASQKRMLLLAAGGVSVVVLVAALLKKGKR